VTVSFIPESSALVVIGIGQRRGRFTVVGRHFPEDMIFRIIRRFPVRRAGLVGNGESFAGGNPATDREESYAGDFRFVVIRVGFCPGDGGCASDIATARRPEFEPMFA